MFAAVLSHIWIVFRIHRLWLLNQVYLICHLQENPHNFGLPITPCPVIPYGYGSILFLFLRLYSYIYFPSFMLFCGEKAQLFRLTS